MNTQPVRLRRALPSECVPHQAWWGVIASVMMLLLAVSLRSSEATIYYLNPGSAASGWGAGSDLNNGTSISTPWKTVHKVKTAVTSGTGHTINILGGTYTSAQYQGEGGTPAWTAAQSKGASGSPIIFQPYDTTPIIFNGQNSQAYWMNWTGDADYYVVMNCNNLMTFQNYAGVVFGVGGSTTPGSQHITIQNCVMKDMKDNQAAGIVTGPSSYLIFRGNTVLNSGDNTLGGQNLPNAQHCIYLGSYTQFAVVDQNRLEKCSGYGVHSHQAGGFVSKNLIVRRNTIANTHQNSIIYDTGTQDNTYTYNNSMYNSATPFSGWDSFYTTQYAQGGALYQNTSQHNTYYLNNIHYGYVRDSPSIGGPILVPNSSVFNADLLMDYNMNGNLGPTTTKTYYWNNTAYTLATFQSTIVRDLHSLEGDPKFVSLTPGALNFALQSSSPARNTGTTLTTTTTTCSSNSVTLADAGFFHDGYGMVAGDDVQIGASVVTLTGVNYSTKVITWGGAALTCASGTPVSLPYNENAPDMGALEYTPPVIPATTGGIDLDGIDDYLTAGTSSAYQCSNATCTLMGWFRSAGGGTNTGAGYIFAKRSLAGDVGGYFLRVDAAGTLTGRTYDAGGAPVVQKATSATTAKDGSWHCFAMVFTTVTAASAGNDISLYYDGVLDTVSGGTGSGNGYDNTNNPLVFGALSDFDASGWLNGAVEDLRFYTSGLSAENVARYCSSKVKFGGFGWGSLLSYWPLNQCAEGASGDAVAFNDVNKGGSAATGNDGANNTGVTCHGTNRMTYPPSVE